MASAGLLSKIEHSKDVGGRLFVDACVRSQNRLLASKIIGPGMIPKKYPEEASHVAVSAVNGIDYLLTWNLSHIANATLRNNFERLVRSEEYEMPIICTPEEFTEAEL